MSYSLRKGYDMLHNLFNSVKFFIDGYKNMLIRNGWY